MTVDQASSAAVPAVERTRGRGRIGAGGLILGLLLALVVFGGRDG